MFLVISIFCFLFTLPGTIELLFLSLGALLPKQEDRSLLDHPSSQRTCVIIPAHNEEKLIERCLHSLLNSSSLTPPKLVVIADHCTDHTVEIVSKFPEVQIIERHNSQLKGKPHALAYGFKQLENQYDHFIIIDADSQVAPNFIQEIQKAFLEGAEVVQSRYLLNHPHPTLGQRLIELAFVAFNDVRPKGRAFWNLSCGILGNGFAVSKNTLQRVPFDVDSAVEDVDYHLKLVMAQIQVKRVSTTKVTSTSPPTLEGLAEQRTRWDMGRLEILQQQLIPLLKSLKNGNFQVIEPLLDLLTLPLTIYIFSILTIIISNYSLFKYYLLFSSITLILHGACAIKLGGKGLNDIWTVLIAPFYLLWKWAQLPKMMVTARKKVPWKRTER